MLGESLCEHIYMYIYIDIIIYIRYAEIVEPRLTTKIILTFIITGTIFLF